MKQLEIIEVRISKNERDLLKLLLKDFIQESEETGYRQAVRIYMREHVDSDLSIHLYHSSENDQLAESQLGLNLTAALRDYGIVHHSVWSEVN